MQILLQLDIPNRNKSSMFTSQDRFDTFYTTAAKYCTDLLINWGQSLSNNSLESILNLMDDFIANDQLFNDSTFIKSFSLDYK